jgi:hypothetical protein
MSKHQIFLVHGMGNFELGWSDGVRKRITDAFKAYPKMHDNGWVDKFEFKEINYNDVFEQWRKQWRADAQAAADALTATGLESDTAAKLIQAAGASGGTGFLATHVLDVVAFRFLMPIAQTVCRSVQLQILGHLNSLPSGDAVHYSVVAHSLGTSVVYETFHAVLTNGVDGNGTRLGTSFLPDNIFMVANMAKLLWNRGGNPYPQTLSPDLADGDGLCFSFSSFRHALDPIPAVDRFNPPDDWFTPTAPMAEVYLDSLIPAADVQDINVHSFEHYLSHPLVHVPLLRTLTGMPGNVTKKELDDALSAWRANRLSNQKLAAAQARLRGLAAKATADWVPEVQMLLAMRQLAQRSTFTDGES